MRTLRTTLVLLLFWTVVVPTEGWLDLAVGALAAYVVARWALWLLWPQRREALNIRPQRLPLFLADLLWRIVVSAFSVLRVVFDPRLPIEPMLVRQSFRFESDAARVTYANSISVTPGTLTLDLEGDQLIVHALDPAMAREVSDGRLARSVAALFGEANPGQRHG